MVRLTFISFLGLLLSSSAICAQTTIDACNLFDVTENEAWPFVYTAVESDDPSSSAEQVFEIVVDELPSDGASVRVAKTVANGNWFFGEPIPLELGSNVITVTAVSFPRTVKFQFSSGEVAFSVLLLNYLDVNTCVASTGGVAVASCSAFEPGPNETWTHVLTAVTSDDPSSGEEQTLEIEVSALPAGGAEYRVAKTVANGNWFFGNPVELSLGLNTVSVSAVAFQRTVKFQFSSGEVEFTALAINGEPWSAMQMKRWDVPMPKRRTTTMPRPLMTVRARTILLITAAREPIGMRPQASAQPNLVARAILIRTGWLQFPICWYF